MSDVRHDHSDLPEARTLRGRWPGIVWAIPLAALIIVGYLGIRALTRHGVEATVQFGYAEGVTPGDTKVLENGVEIGKVKRVRVSADGHHVDVILTLDPRARKSLNTNSMFWLIGENPTITDIQSVRAAITGVIIALAPGTGGQPTRRFTGLDQPPLISPGSQGTIYYLRARKLGSVQPGAAVVYRGLQIGQVIQTGLKEFEGFRMGLFINAPYDRLIRQGGQFWSGSAIKFSLSGASVAAGLSNPKSVLQGSVDYELPDEARANPQARAGTKFILYDDQSAAQQGPTGPEVPYRLMLKGSAGDLQAGTDVKMLGYTVGQIVSANLRFGPGGQPYTEAVVNLYPHKFDVSLPHGAPFAQWRGASDRAVDRLLGLGYRMKMIQSPPLVGAHTLILSQERAGPARLVSEGGFPLLPVVETGSGADIMDKINALPIEEIGQNVRALTGNLARITGSREVRDSIVRLDSTLKQLDQIMGQVKPEIGPMMKKLNRAADELQRTAGAARATLTGEGAAQDRSLPDAIQQLDGAARSIRALTDYLGRHPEALIRGKAKEKAQ